MNPHFPDLVEQWAAEEAMAEDGDCANDNRNEHDNDFADPLLTALGRLEIAATRLW